MKITAIHLIALTLFGGVLLLAQEPEQTIEELYLQSAIKTQIIKAEAATLDRDMKKLALESIEEMIANEQQKSNPEISIILRGLAGEGVTTVMREGGVVVNDFPEIRREAARLLGELGTQEAADNLKTILLTDPEPMVMSEAIIAMSKIGVRDTATRDRTLAEAIYRQTAINKDNNFAFAYLSAIENIITREGKVGNIMVIEEIAKLANARQGYNTRIQKKALQLLKNLKEF